MTPQQAEALLRISPAVWFASCAKIFDKSRKLITPVPNIFQLRIFHAYEWCIQNGRPPRIICLKPRRVGGTTACAGLSYHHSRRFPTRHVSIADTNDKSDILFQMFCRYAEKDAFDWGTTFRSNNVMGRFSNNSETLKRSAEAPKQTRGDTLQSVHESEACVWKDVGPYAADETAAALLSALSEGAHTLGLNESTAKGARGYFFNEWRRARWPHWTDGPQSLCSYWSKYSVQNNDKDASEWLRVFAAWYEFPEYTCGPHQANPGLQAVASDDEADDIIATLDVRERALIDLYGIDLNQVKWRRWMIRNKLLNQVSRFMEEYPSNPDECFLQSGSPVFDSDGLVVIEKITKAMQCDFGRLIEQSRSQVVGWQKEEEMQAWAQIWEHPRAGRRYLISVDVMTGESEIYDGENQDRHSVQVWRDGYRDEHGVYHKPMLVARIKPPYQEDNSLMCQKIMRLSRYYGECIIAVEANKGVAVLAKLRDEYNANLYVREENDSTTNKTTKKLGWDTNTKTRDIIIDAIQDACRDQTHDIPCPNLLDEMKTFIRDKTGKRTAGSGAKDDDVLAAGMGIHLLRFATIYREERVPLPEAPDERAWR